MEKETREVRKYTIYSTEGQPLGPYRAEHVKGDLYSLKVPKGTEFLYAREQYDYLCLWTLEPKLANTEKVNIEITILGSRCAPILEEGKFIGRYLGSGHFQEGSLVLHAFLVDSFISKALKSNHLSLFYKYRL